MLRSPDIKKVRKSLKKSVSAATGKSRRLSQSCVIALGGSGNAVADVEHMARSLAGRVLHIDTDVAVLDDASFNDPIHLSSGGSMEAILDNKDQYPLLRGQAVPSYAQGFEADSGVGMIRMATTILLAYNQHDVRRRLRKLLQHTQAEFNGRQAKHLDVHLVFSLAGGSGSALGVCIAAMVLDIVRSMAPTMTVSVQAHCFAPTLFTALDLTPTAEQRVLANAAMTLREFAVAQQPALLAPLADALGIAPLKRPLFSSVNIYDASDSGGGFHPLHTMSDLVAANIVASDCPSLRTVISSRGVNSRSADDGTGFESSVVACMATRMLRLPVDKLRDGFKATVASELLARATKLAEPERVRALHRALLPVLELETVQRDAAAAFRPDPTCKLQLDFNRVSTPDLINSANRASQRWERRGRVELRQKYSRLAEEHRRLAVAKCEQFVKECRRQMTGLAEGSSAVRDVLETLHDRLAEQQSMLQELAKRNQDENQRMAMRNLQNPSSRWRGAKGRRQAVIQAHNGLVDAEVREATLRLHMDYLAPLIDSLTETLMQFEELKSGMDTLRLQVDKDLERLKEDIGYETDYFSEVIAPGEVAGVLEKIAKDIAISNGSKAQLSVANLVNQGPVSGDVRKLLDGIGDELDEQFQGYILGFRDIRGFVGAFKLAFSVDDWLRESLESLTLPAKLNLAVVPAGHCPTTTYLIGSREAADRFPTLRRHAPDLAIEVRESDDPFQLVLCAKISRAPFASIPNLTEMERAYHSFLAGAPVDHLWGVLCSHLGALGIARDVELLPLRRVDAA